MQCAPAASQRYHWYAYLIFPEPVHVPATPVSFFACTAGPVAVGDTVATGPPAAGGGVVGGGGGVAGAPRLAVARLRTARVADAVFACTIATSACFASRGTIVCEAVMSPEIGAHARPFALQRIHWYANDFGAGVHLPLSTFTLPPTAVVVPVTPGCTTETSRGFRPAIGPISPE